MEAINIGTFEGLICLEADTQRIIDLGNAQNNQVNDILEDDGVLWLATEGGLILFDGVNIEVFNRGLYRNFPRSVRCLAKHKSSIYFGADSSLYRMKNGFLSVYSLNGVSHGEPVFDIKSLNNDVVIFSFSKDSFDSNSRVFIEKGGEVKPISEVLPGFSSDLADVGFTSVEFSKLDNDKVYFMGVSKLDYKTPVIIEFDGKNMKKYLISSNLMTNVKNSTYYMKGFGSTIFYFPKNQNDTFFKIDFNQPVSAKFLSDEDINTLEPIYPNPSKSIVFMDIDKKDFYQILNPMGKALPLNLIVEDSRLKIDVSELKSGIYMVQTSKGIFKLMKE